MNVDYLKLIATGIPWTIVVTAGSFAVGALLAIPLCAMHVSTSRLLHWLAVGVILFCRSIPPIVWLFVLYFGLGSGYLPVGPIQASIIALGVITAANMAEIYRGALKSIHFGQWEACQALNLPRWSQFWDVLVPQLFRVTLPSAASYIIGLLKDSAIASMIGVTEIAYQAAYITRQSHQGIEVFSLAALIYILISLPIAGLARYTDGVMRAKVAQ